MERETTSITLLVDNHPGEGLQTEHGLSFLIRNGKDTVLFDTGQGQTLFANAAMLKADPAAAGILVLSHGHYDHTGGIAEVLRRNPAMRVHYHPGVLDAHWSRHDDGAFHDISMPSPSRQALERHDPALKCPSEGPEYITDALRTTGAVPRLAPFEDTGGAFFRDAAGIVPDEIPDDQSMWLSTPTGLVIVLGCCHAGVVNTVEYIRELSRTERIRGIIGGMHLVNASPARLARTAAYLHDRALEFLIPCHCSGDEATAWLRSELGGCVRFGHVGMEIRV